MQLPLIYEPSSVLEHICAHVSILLRRLLSVCLSFPRWRSRWLCFKVQQRVGHAYSTYLYFTLCTCLLRRALLWIFYLECCTERSLRLVVGAAQEVKRGQL